MSDGSLFASIPARDLGNSTVNGFLAHPDFRTISAFFLGWVFLNSIYYLLCSALVHALLRLCYSRLRRPFGHTPAGKRPADLEAHLPSEKSPESMVPQDRRAVGHDFYEGAFALVLNICFAFAAFAQFCSLLDFGSHVGNTGCTFVVAWGSMASQASRLVGLLMLSWKLRRYGVRRWETYALWTGLVVALALIFALNATSTGSTTVVLQLEIALCYKQQYLPITLATSLVLIFLELYVGFRLLSIAFSRHERLSTSSLSINLARAASLLVLDLLTLVPAVIYLNVLATFIPFTVGALLVIAVFNYTESHQPEPGSSLRPYHASDAGSVLDVNRMSSRTINSLLTPRPFMLRFPSYHEPANIPEAVVLEDEQTSSTDAVENVRSLQLFPIDPDVEDAIIEASQKNLPLVPRSAPARLDNSQNFTTLPSRQILPFQTQFAEQLDKEAELTAPAVRRPRDRPQVFVVIEEEEDVPAAKSPVSTVFGSDIIRLTPRTTRRRRHETILLTPASSSFSPRNSSSHGHSFVSTRSSLRDSILSAYTPRSPQEASPIDDSRLRSYWNGNVSPRDSLRPKSWRTNSASGSHVSVTGSRTPVRELPELPAVMEKSADGRLSTSTSRVRSKRRTFGRQSFRYMPQDMMQALKPHESLAPILPVSIPGPSLSQIFREPALQPPPHIEPIPPPPAAIAIGRGRSAEQMRYPPIPPIVGMGRGRGRMDADNFERPGGTLRGPRPPPTPLSPSSLDEWRGPAERKLRDSERSRKRRSSFSDLPSLRQEIQ
ncbi:hypothetical protein B0H21DRAFT_716659 [Amylocystis lapponica]|nr:hypothetical protein B0H21DRAFT_716659 [Amylocystis lapponica]